jgi:AraC-like DNA-binding protein
LIVLVDGIQIVSILIIQKVLRLEVIVFLLVLTAINLLYFKGFVRPIESRVGFNFEDLKLSTSMTSRKRLNASLLENKVLIDRLEKHLNTTASYKNPQLTIGLLAQEIDIPKRKLSELINDHYDQNFVDFINTYRINCAKHRLLNPNDPKETILEVMYEVGFNSKSSFHKAFKKKTGSTPAEYKSR